MDPVEENDVEMIDDGDIILPFDDEVELSPADILNIAFGSHVLNERQTASWSKACIHPLNCDESPESMQEMVARFQKNPGNLSREFLRRTPLSEALNAGHAKCVDFLIQCHTDRSELLPLKDMLYHGIKAPEGKFTDVLQVLIKNNFLDWNRIYETGEMKKAVDFALSYISEQGRVGALQCMIIAGMPVDPPNTTQCQAPLMDTILQSSLDCYKLLLLHGAKHRATFMENDDEGNGGLIRVEYPIPILLVMTTTTCYNDQPELLMPMLKLFKQCGGDLWEKTQRDLNSFPWYVDGGHEEIISVCKAGQNALDFLKSNPELLGKFPAGTLEELQQLMATPLSLAELARAQILQTLGTDFLRSIPHMWIPGELKKFLEF